MSVFRRTNSPQDEPTVDIKRPARFVGRVLLWGCVLLLLIRGAVSYLDGDSPVVTTTRGVGVTVTKPAGSVPSNAKR